MAVRDLIPWGRARSTLPSAMGEEFTPFTSLHREMNRLIDDMFNRFETGMPSLLGRPSNWPGGSWAGGSWPSLEVHASDNEVRVSAELPGMDEKDIEVLVDNDVLTIRGEKKSETEDKDRRFSERYYGRFERRIPLSWEVDEDKIEASFRNGVLTVTLPKSAESRPQVKRVAINRAGEETKH
jgi:HSP20 family protein